MRKSIQILLLGLAVSLAGCEDESARPQGSVKAAVYNGYYGAVYKRYAVTTEDRELSYWVQDLVQDYAGSRVGNAPTQFEAASAAGCAIAEDQSGR